MNGAHDLGGMHGFGPVDRSQKENFAAEWEQKVFALTLACGFQSKWNLDMSRFAREQMDPAHYLGSSYYEHWLHGLQLLLVSEGLLSADELATMNAQPSNTFVPVAKDQVAGILQSGAPTSLPQETPQQYQVGELIITHNAHPKSHTRLPRYIRGRIGEIINHHGAHIFPDVHASTGEKKPEHLYTVKFTGEQLWGASTAEPNTAVNVDVFEPYIAGIA
jgi:nitrile hydratase